MTSDSLESKEHLQSKCKAGFKVVMALFYIVAGINHELNPAIYLHIMPSYLPFTLLLVYLSGFFEVVLGFLLLIPRFTPLAAWGIIALLIAVFPANIHMALHPGLTPGIPYLLLLVRLPVQGLLILWAYWFTNGQAIKGSIAEGKF